ncbi:MAG: hypothetical protein NT049_11315 [Planctomycetota bacterium]|nr:hypothetical protein [Planctomycetota bacterium]
MTRLWGGGQIGKELPRPQWTVVLLWVLGIILWIVCAMAILVSAIITPAESAAQFLMNRGVLVFLGLSCGAFAIGLAQKAPPAGDAARGRGPHQGRQIPRRPRTPRRIPPPLSR